MAVKHTSHVDDTESRMAQWLREQQRSQVWLALKLGISPATMSRIVCGQTMPRAATAQKIARVTNGQVTAADLVQAKTSHTPANRAARIRHAKTLIQRGQSMLTAAAEER